MRNPSFLKIAVAVVAATLGTASAARCDSFSVSLISNGGGVYEYGITLPANNQVDFSGNTTSESITISGMSGVTGASVSGLLASFGWSVASFNSSSVTFDISPFTSDLANFGSVPFTWGTFSIDSASPLGTVNWSGNDDAGSFSGTVGGPVGGIAATPEPGSLSMLLTGIALVGLLYFSPRRRGLFLPPCA